jgi:hypothetical protein
MKRPIILGSLGAVVLAAFALTMYPHFAVVAEEKMAMPFGGKEDVDFASKAWKAMEGYQKWLVKSDMVPGKSPHGAFVQVYYSMVNVDGKPYHVIIKDNFTPGKKLAAVTVMIQREAGYDSDNHNWFWVKYDPDGAIGKNDQGMALAGRVAKGMDMGCIACHKGASGKDYIFINDAGTYGR